MIQIFIGIIVLIFSLAMIIVAIIAILPSSIEESGGMSFMGFGMAGGMAIISGFVGYWLIIGRELSSIFAM